MKPLHFGAAILCAFVWASSASAQTSVPASPASSDPASQPGTAAASGNGNQAIATTHASALQPAYGANSFTRGQATSRLKHHGFQDIAAMKKGKDGVWRGTGTKDGSPVEVWVDYKGNVGQQ